MQAGDKVKIVKILEQGTAEDCLDTNYIGKEGIVQGEYTGPKPPAFLTKKAYWVCLNPTDHIDNWLYEEELEKVEPAGVTA